MSENGDYSVLLALLIALTLFVAFVLEAHQPISHEEVCARELGISWSVGDGATEELEAFQDCVIERRK